MQQESHGNRYSDKEKHDILIYLENHTYKETCDKFSISETTLARWRKTLSSSVSDIMSRIIVSIPPFWLDYLNDNIANGVWKNYDDAIIQLVRFYNNANKQESSIVTDVDFTSQLEEYAKKLEIQNPDIIA